MPKIYIARHGQDEDNASGILNGRRDMPLTSIGVEQAHVLAEKIRGLELDIKKAYSSPLQRAYKTGEIITSVLNIEKPEKVDLLVERDFGIMTGKPIKDIEELCSPDIIKSDPIVYFLSPEKAETFPVLLNRAGIFLNWLADREDEGNVLIVAHGDIGKMIYAKFYDIDWKEILVSFHFGNSEVLLLEKGSKPEDRYLHKVVQHNH